MKQKTAMMELIEKWEIQMRIYFPKDLVHKALIRDAKELIEKEKEQIMMAYNDGRVNQGLKQSKKSEQYYNETYKQD